MPRFRKKPIVIEAELFFGDTMPWPAGVVDYWPMEPDGVRRYGPLQVHTPEGPLLVSDGDWIITGVNGEKHLCKPDVFEATYEEVYPRKEGGFVDFRAPHGAIEDDA